MGTGASSEADSTGGGNSPSLSASRSPKSPSLSPTSATLNASGASGGSARSPTRRFVSVLSRELNQYEKLAICGAQGSSGEQTLLTVPRNPEAARRALAMLNNDDGERPSGSAVESCTALAAPLVIDDATFVRSRSASTATLSGFVADESSGTIATEVHKTAGAITVTVPGLSTDREHFLSVDRTHLDDDADTKDDGALIPMIALNGGFAAVMPPNAPSV